MSVSARTPRLVVNNSVIHAELDDEVVLLNVENGVYFGLDAVGARMWQLIEQGATQEEIIARLLAEYDAEPSQLDADVREFTRVLVSKGLAREVSE